MSAAWEVESLSSKVVSSLVFQMKREKMDDEPPHLQTSA